MTKRRMTEKQAYSWLTQMGILTMLFRFDKDTNEALKVAIESLGKKIESEKEGGE